MPIDAPTLKALVESELALVSDKRVVAHVRALLVEPSVMLRKWDYGRADERYPCWTVLRHSASNSGIGYCEHGFGPRSPWGVVTMEGDEWQTSLGMDDAWYTTFLQALFATHAPKDLPIWRVFKTDSSTGQKLPITDEGDWDATWERVMALRDEDPANRYDCFSDVEYERE